MISTLTSPFNSPENKPLSNPGRSPRLVTLSPVDDRGNKIDFSSAKPLRTRISGSGNQQPTKEEVRAFFKNNFGSGSPQTSKEELIAYFKDNFGSK